MNNKNNLFKIMNEDLDSLSDWFNANKLSLNVKTAVAYCFQILKFHKDVS